VQDLKRKYTTRGGAVHTSDTTNAFAFDVVGKLAGSATRSHLETETNVLDLHKGIYDALFLGLCMGHYPGSNETLYQSIHTRLARVVRNGEMGSPSFSSGVLIMWKSAPRRWKRRDSAPNGGLVPRTGFHTFCR
jgi:hypothetical protein